MIKYRSEFCILLFFQISLENSFQPNAVHCISKSTSILEKIFIILQKYEDCATTYKIKRIHTNTYKTHIKFSLQTKKVHFLSLISVAKDVLGLSLNRLWGTILDRFGNLVQQKIHPPEMNRTGWDCTKIKSEWGWAVPAWWEPL